MDSETDGIAPVDTEESDDSEDDGNVSSEEDGEYDSTSDEDKQFQAEFKAHKRNYYMDKLEYDAVDRYVAYSFEGQTCDS